MKCLTKKEWLLPCITAVSVILSFTELTHAQKHPTPLPPNHPDAQLDPSLFNVPPMPEPILDQPLSGPLPPDHPDAQLDPSLFNVPPMPERQEGSGNIFSTASPDREISYDIDTGSIQIGSTGSIQPSSSSKVSPPNLGADANVEQEPMR